MRPAMPLVSSATRTRPSPPPAIWEADATPTVHPQEPLTWVDAQLAPATVGETEGMLDPGAALDHAEVERSLLDDDTRLLV